MSSAVTTVDSPTDTEEHFLDIDKLLVLVQSHPAIYNLSLKEHHNQDVLTKIWALIAKELNVPVQVCKTKWTNLRNGYNRYVRELKKNPSGSGQKKKKWHLFDAMQFLQPWTGSTRVMSSNLTASAAPPLTDARETAHIGTTEASTTPSEEEFQEEGEITTPVHEKTVEFVPMKKKPKTAAEIVAAPMVDFLKVATEKRKNDHCKQENAMLTFFKSLIPDTDLLTNENKRKFKLQVMTTLNNFIDQQSYNQQSRNESYPPTYQLPPPISPSESLTSNSAGASSSGGAYHELQQYRPHHEHSTNHFWNTDD